MPNYQNTRHNARERAFQLLYSLNFIPIMNVQALAEAFYLVLKLESTNTKLYSNIFVDNLSWELVYGVWDHCIAIDATISKVSQHWRLERIGRIELAILRLTLYEIFYRTDVPVKVAIDEAIKLAKRFGDINSRNFINGILDAASRSLI